jgi:large conductance mechanosensitive channel
MQGELIVIAVGLVVALAFSTLIKSFTANVVTPFVNAIGGPGSAGLGFTVRGQQVMIGAFIGDVIYFVILMAVIYFVIVVPYRAYMARRGTAVFGDPPPTKTCPACLSDDLPVAASRCRHCTTDLAASAT